MTLEELKELRDGAKSWEWFLNQESPVTQLLDQCIKYQQALIDIEALGMRQPIASSMASEAFAESGE